MAIASSRSAATGLVIGCVIFGLGSLIVAHVDIGGWAMSFWRLAISGVVFAILAKMTGQRLPRSKRAVFYGLLSGAFLGLDLALWHESIYAVGPGISTLLNSLQIFFLAAIGFLYFNERQSILQLISLFLAMLGVAMIGSPEFAQNTAATWGFVTGIVSGAMLAASMTFIRKTHDTEPTPIFMLMQLVSIGGVIAMILPMFIFDMGNILPSTWSEIGWILIYGTVMQCLAWGLIAYSIPKLSLALTGLLLLTEPIAALVIDYSWLDKPINTLQWSGALLTMFAIYLGSLKPKPRALRRYRFFARFYKRNYK
ncbi:MULTISPECIES: DMT family transporter [Psychrobacter]|jgi:drug/metabolite transporter (DMT)-like permease|uniref:DMT family transporter n=2 Tax=Psychrobacter TaxID=497 RepID=A0ABR8RK28_9GAMM|nr:MULTISPECIES: DMT family transporter [Psychrobacter]MBD7948115.1 DMT family transporter [Psychrobacter communis]MDP4546010.1 DMT family transporter [Psychrobacter faecalis]PKG86666.1 EamA family transporter [Psychrobacter sp. Sarcosine-02u-2]WLW65300.1 DMT family transporter [Psychrobacter sp. van23A]HCR88612.1 EamA/RhaT family transporter [Psychrobacter sp.]